MLTVEFWIFVVVVLLLHNITRDRIQNLVLLFASYIFYLSIDWRFLGLLILATTVTHQIARRLRAHSAYTPNTLDVPRQRRFLTIGVLFNLGILGFFKYAEFFIESASAALAPLGVSQITLQILLPVGISFYTFRLLAYLFDVHTGRIEPSASWIEVALYTAFFPQLASGPIERAARFLPNLRKTRRLGQQDFVDGLTYICLGLVYKIAIADPQRVITDNAFRDSTNLAAHDVVAVIVLLSIRLYADFAGYSAIAKGISTWFGLPAMENFRQPYFAQSVVEFWTRWHISLSTWLRDYLFYPLTRTLLRRWGSARGYTVQIIGYFVTMLATGLWHGANWTFIVWGGLHGIYMVVEGFIARARPDSDRGGPWQQRFSALGNILVTQIAVALAWVIFYAPTVPDAVRFLGRLLTPTYNVDAIWWARLLYPISLLLLVDLLLSRGANALVFWRLQLPWRVALCVLLLIVLFIVGGPESAPFVYFRF
jgi:alginate O-acetyltransferase complex protein AlgI